MGPDPEKISQSDDQIPGLNDPGHEADLKGSLPTSDATPEGGNPAASEPSACCPKCQFRSLTVQEYCINCGWIFATGEAPDKTTEIVPPPSTRVNQRYELGELIARRGPLSRFRSRGFLANDPMPIPVVLLRSPVQTRSDNEPVAEAEPPDCDEAVSASQALCQDEQADAPFVEAEGRSEPAWPSIAWETALLEKLRHPALPRLIDHFTDDGFEYLIEERPAGRSLWDAWDDLDASASDRFGWLVQIVELLRELYGAGVLIESLRPDLFVITPTGQVKLTELSELIPLPIPRDASLRGTAYTPPELVLASDFVDARAALYGFGAMLYALHVGRELTELDFETPGVPKPFLTRFPEAHPALARLISKTFVRDLDKRFPTEEARLQDPTGFTELLSSLESCRCLLEKLRLDIAAWSTTGMVRTGNEDSFIVVHGSEARQDRLEDAALLLLADGMGGYEAGELAAAMAVRGLRRFLLQQQPFARLAGGASLPDLPKELDLQACQRTLVEGLREVNRLVYAAGRSNLGKKGMGCTAEAVYINGQHVVVGHVGDSRTYHYSRGQLVQLTRDQTLVCRLVELGHLTPEEARNHPRRGELQQAIGGYPDLDPETVCARLQPGDWLLLCSDGLSNHVADEEINEVLQRATCAEQAARRLVNLANLLGASDNVTVILVRAS